MTEKSLRGLMLFGVLWACAAAAPVGMAQSNRAGAEAGFDDHQNMMDQLGVKALRPGANGQAKFDEANANPYKASMPDALTMKDGTKVTRPEQWPARRAEILEDFEREIYGRIPSNVPKVSWEVTTTTRGMSGNIPTVTSILAGRVDNSAYPQIEVTIQASFTVPEQTTAPVPVMLEFGGFFGPPRGGGPARRGGPPRGAPPAARGGNRPLSWTDQAIAKGWGYGFINPGSIQPDNDQLTRGIIGLTNLGRPRKPDDWGALRAWGWGVSRLIDYFDAHPEAKVDPKKVGIEGVSRYGKAALVAEAFDERVAVGFVASSGEGGAKLHRHVFGEALENLTGGESYWMAGNIIKYGASDPPKTAADLPVDSHELIALCAPRPCFISYGSVAGGDPDWVDAHGSFMAGVLAGPVYRLLGKKDFGTPGDYLTDPMPPVNTLIGGELAWRQHDGGHTSGPNWPAFFEWAGGYIAAPPLPASKPSASAGAVGGGPSMTGIAARPAPRNDANSKLAHAQLLEKAKQGRIDVYFEGDSITRRWGGTDYPAYLANWKENFFGWNAADFAWGGDSTQHILWRLQNGELDGVNPKVIVLQAGTNNVSGAGRMGDPEAMAADVTGGIQALLETCQEKAPGAAIILTAVFPRNDNMASLPVIAKINENIAKFADGKKIRFLNINDKLADKDGKLYEGMMRSDKLHLDLKGYQVWADALKPILTEILGPPAKQDLAPPPTGDPSATAPLN